LPVKSFDQSGTLIELEKDIVMAKNEKTSSKVAKTASKGLRTGKLTPKEIKSVSGAALTQAPDKPKKK